MIANKSSELFRCKLLSARIEKNQPAARASAIAPAEFQECGFIFEAASFGFGILAKPFQVIVSNRLDRLIFRFADPCDSELHGFLKS